jgi:hypothetical protein
LGAENGGYRTSSISADNIERRNALSTELGRYVLVNILLCPPPDMGSPVWCEGMVADGATVRLVIVAVIVA